MKKIVYGLMCCTTLMACQQEEGYRIIGSVPGASDGTKVYMLELWNPVDSAVMKDGKFEMRGKVESPNLYRIYLDMSPEAKEMYRKELRGGDVFVENSVIEYTCESIDSMPGAQLDGKRNKPENLKIRGSRTHDLYMAYLSSMKSLKAEKSAAWQAYLSAYHVPAIRGVFNTREGLELTKRMLQAEERMEQKRKAFIQEHPTSPVAVIVAREQIEKGRGKLLKTRSEIDQILQSIDPSLRNTDAYVNLKKNVERLHPTFAGEKYTDIELVNKKGEPVRLKDFIKPGQYNMLEFWASWCGPCRAEIPHLKHVSEVYSDKDLHVISISLDQDPEAWHKALKEENMTWTQLRDAKGRQGEVSSKYHVTGIPFSLILDGEGRIVAAGVRGSELDMVLIERVGDKFRE